MRSKASTRQASTQLVSNRQPSTQQSGSTRVNGWSKWVLELDQLDPDADRDLPATGFACVYNDSVPPHRDDDEFDVPQSQRPGCATAKDFGTYLLARNLPLHRPPLELFLEDMHSRINNDIRAHGEFRNLVLTNVYHDQSTRDQAVYCFGIEVSTNYPPA